MIATPVLVLAMLLGTPLVLNTPLALGTPLLLGTPSVFDSLEPERARPMTEAATVTLSADVAMRDAAVGFSARGQLPLLPYVGLSLGPTLLTTGETNRLLVAAGLRNDVPLGDVLVLLVEYGAHMRINIGGDAPTRAPCGFFAGGLAYQAASDLRFGVGFELSAEPAELSSTLDGILRITMESPVL